MKYRRRILLILLIMAVCISTFAIDIDTAKAEDNSQKLFCVEVSNKDLTYGDSFTIFVTPLFEPVTPMYIYGIFSTPSDSGVPDFLYEWGLNSSVIQGDKMDQHIEKLYIHRGNKLAYTFNVRKNMPKGYYDTFSIACSFDKSSYTADYFCENSAIESINEASFSIGSRNIDDTDEKKHSAIGRLNIENKDETNYVTEGEECQIQYELSAWDSVTGETIDPAGHFSLSWSSSNKKVATVNGDGIVRGISPGEVIIKAQVNEIPNWFYNLKFVVIEKKETMPDRDGDSVRYNTYPKDDVDAETDLYDSDWRYWSQGASRHQKIRQVGCHIISSAKMIVELGIESDTSTFNPEVLYQWLITNKIIESSVIGEPSLGGFVNEYSKAKGYELEIKRVQLDSNKSKLEQAKTLMDLLKNGYGLCLLSASGQPEHMTYVNREESLEVGTPIIFDTLTSWSYNEKYQHIKFTDYNNRAVAVWDRPIMGIGVAYKVKKSSENNVQEDTQKEDNKAVPMFRLFNKATGEHFYTSDIVERESLSSIGWMYEGVGWYAPLKSSTPVYRLYNPNDGDHHYTTSLPEREICIKAGWIYEGIGWYSDDSKCVPVYREYNPNVSVGSHNYTSSRTEHSYLVKIGWKDENIGWYGVENQ